MASSLNLAQTLLRSPFRHYHYRLLSTRAIQLAAQHHQSTFSKHRNPVTLSTCSCSRSYTTLPQRAPRTDNRPRSEETTQTDFGIMDIYSQMAAPTSAIDACTIDGFALNSGLRVTGTGVLIVGGEAFAWRPWVREDGSDAARSGEKIRGKRSEVEAIRQSVKAFGHGKLVNKMGQWEAETGVWGLMDVVWPKPDLLIIGTGASMLPVSPATRNHLGSLGIRIEIADTRNAAAQFNLLATERGVQQVAAALVPIGWKDSQ